MRRKLIRNLNKLAFYYLVKKGIVLSEATSDEELNKFFCLVRPHRTNHNLIRVGSEADGGYLLPNDLEGISCLYSPGVEKTASFELDIANRGIKCFMADYSVDSAPFHHENFIFEKKFIGISDDDVYMKLSTWVSKSNAIGNDFILQMDIEGAEFEVLMDLDEKVLQQFRVMIIEFHDFDGLLNRSSFRLINLTFRKLLKYFEIVHIHPNNSNKPIKYLDYEIFHALEFTFLRKDRIANKSIQTNFPHALDKSCVPNQADYALPSCWYSN